MKQLKDGSIKFVGKKNKVYIFEGKNFKKHYSKHPSIRNEWFLKKVEKTLNAPDVKATDKKKPNTIFYKVIRVFRPGRSVQAIKVVTFWDERKKGEGLLQLFHS